jgi:hypothetical protein
MGKMAINAVAAAPFKLLEFLLKKDDTAKVTVRISGFCRKYREN